MRTRKQAHRLAQRLFRLCLADGRLDEARMRLVVQRVAGSGGSERLLVLEHLRMLVKRDAARHTVRIESAVPLDGTMQAAIQSRVEQRYGSGLTFVFDVRESLIGGLRIQVGDDVYDGSVEAGLATLAKGFESRYL